MPFGKMLRRPAKWAASFSLENREAGLGMEEKFSKIKKVVS